MKKKLILFNIFFLLSVFFVNSQVNFQWAKSMGGGLNDAANSIAVDGTGNVYTTGTFSGTSDFDPGPSTFNLTSPGQEGVFISKLDASGLFVWAKCIGGAGSDYGFSLSLDGFGNVYSTGSFSGTVDFDPGPGIFNITATGQANVFISKLNSSGSFVWARSIGGTNYELGTSLTVDLANNIYTTGYFQGTADFDPGAGVYNITSAGSNDIFISKLDASGNFIWAKSMGGTSDDIAHSIFVDGSGSVYTTGAFNGNSDFDPGVGVFNLNSVSTNDNVFISKLDVSGNFIWAKILGGAAVNSDVGVSIITDGTGNVYTTGAYNGSADFDPGPGVYNLTSAGGYENIFVSKLNSSGTFVWAETFGGGSCNDVGNSIAIDLTGNIFITGYFGCSVDFDPGPGVSNLTSSGTDVFISELDSNGNFLWAGNMGGGSIDVGQCIVIDPAGSIYITGYFQSTTGDFDPGGGVYNLSTSGNNDVFIVKLNNPVGIEEKSTFNNSVNVYPNPSSGVFKLKIETESNEVENLEIKITNVLGEEILKDKIKEGKAVLDISALNNDIYFLNLFQDNKLITTKKLVKQ